MTITTIEPARRTVDADGGVTAYLKRTNHDPFGP